MTSLPDIIDNNIQKYARAMSAQVRLKLALPSWRRKLTNLPLTMLQSGRMINGFRR